MAKTYLKHRIYIDVMEDDTCHLSIFKRDDKTYTKPHPNMKSVLSKLADEYFVNSSEKYKGE